MSRIYLSVPTMGGRELGYIQQAFDTNWISTVGPNITAFETDFSDRIGQSCVALSSGTAAIQLGLRLLGVGPGDEVFCPTLTFVATANPVLYLGAKPVFLDSETRSWNLDPQLLEEALCERAKINRLPKAVIVVHLFGQAADMDPILGVCQKYDVPVLEDAAEAVGTLYRGKPAGTFGDVAAFSFNGNKIMTTSGGGMLTAKDSALVEKARFWSTQARDPGIAYEHSEMGYNFRMSNILAGIGRGQLEIVDELIDRRRQVAFRYQRAFQNIPGIEFMPQAEYGFHTNWLSCFLIDEDQFGCSRDEVIDLLAREDIESRPIWKPMHLQPLYAQAERFGGDVAEYLFRRGICLPSSPNLTVEDQQRVIEIIQSATKRSVQSGVHFEIGEFVSA